LLIVQFAYSLEFPELVNKVQKNLNIKRFSNFENVHYYANSNTLYKLKNNNFSKINTLSEELLFYEKSKMKGIQKGDKKIYETEHKKLLKKIIESENNLDFFLNKIESFEKKRVLFLEILSDIRTLGIKTRNKIVLERIDRINSLIDEIKYISIGSIIPNLITKNNEDSNQKLKTENNSRKIIVVTNDFIAKWDIAEKK